MRRIVWVAVTILVMLGIMGFGLYTLNHIDEVNKKRREKEAGEKFASTIVMTTATTSIWDKVRASQETTGTQTVPAAPENAEGAVQTTTSDVDAQDRFIPRERTQTVSETTTETVATADAAELSEE